METYERVKRDATWVIVGALLIGFIYNYSSMGRDTTDGDSRSGLGLYVDELTRCQYLSAGGKGITPRLDADGQHICYSTGDTNE